LICSIEGSGEGVDSFVGVPVGSLLFCVSITHRIAEPGQDEKGACGRGAFVVYGPVFMAWGL